MKETGWIPATAVRASTPLLTEMSTMASSSTTISKGMVSFSSGVLFLEI